MGVDARASGVPDAAPADAVEVKVVERIARLLALAESPNRHEAEAAMAAAQRLMLKHNLDAAALRALRAATGSCTWASPRDAWPSTSASWR